MSWDDYTQLTHDDVRSEYIDGALLEMLVPNEVHQRIALTVATVLVDVVEPAARVHLGVGRKPTDDEFGPDVTVHDPEDRGSRLTGVPHLVVEVLGADIRRDSVLKFAKYQAVGLPRYWLVDPDGPALTAYELVDGEYRLIGEFGPDDEADLDVGPARLRIRAR